ncbi:MAG: inorganic pyrophosphatase Ppa [Thermodesulfobacteriota bacterium]
MPFRALLQEGRHFELQAYKKPKEGTLLRKGHVAFSGSPYKHPYDETKVILVSDPFSSGTGYYEFRSRDIAFVEELPSVVNIEGQVLLFVRLWVKKGCRALCCTPFIVEDVLP